MINDIITIRAPAAPVLLSAALLAGCSPGCDIIAAGTFEPIDNPRLKASLESTIGLFPNMAPYRLQAETDEIEARLGTGFGFQYALSGFMEKKDLTATVLHPAMKGVDGTLSTRFTTPWKPERDSITWWFQSQEDMVPGDWTLRVEYQGRALCEKTFSVRLRYVQS